MNQSLFVLSVIAVCVVSSIIPNSVDAASSEIISPDGVKIHYTVDGAGSPPLVFIHCWCCDCTYWDAQRTHFAKQHQVVTIDLAGHGLSGSNRQDWSISNFAGDVKAVIDHLKLDDIVLIGHSMGGPVAVETATLIPNRLIGVVGVDNFQSLKMRFADEQIQEFLEQFKPDFAPAAKDWVGTMFPTGSDSTLIAAISNDMAAGPPEVGLPALEAVLTWFSYKASSKLAALTVPLHCINSDLAPTDIEGLIAGLPAGYYLHLMRKRGHFLMREDPETFNQFLTKSINIFVRKAGKRTH